MPSTNKTLRINTQLAARIDESARRHGQNFTQYVLSWLPDAYERTAEQAADQAQQGQRVAHARRKRSSART